MQGLVIIVAEPLLLVGLEAILLQILLLVAIGGPPMATRRRNCSRRGSPSTTTSCSRKAIPMATSTTSTSRKTTHMSGFATHMPRLPLVRGILVAIGISPLLLLIFLGLIELRGDFPLIPSNLSNINSNWRRSPLIPSNNSNITSRKVVLSVVKIEIMVNLKFIFSW